MVNSYWKPEAEAHPTRRGRSVTMYISLSCVALPCVDRSAGHSVRAQKQDRRLRYKLSAAQLVRVVVAVARSPVALASPSSAAVLRRRARCLLRGLAILLSRIWSTTFFEEIKYLKIRGTPQKTD